MFGEDRNYNAISFILESIKYDKTRMFAARAQNIDIWPEGRHFCSDKEFFRLPRINFSAVFEEKKNILFFIFANWTLL